MKSSLKLVYIRLVLPIEKTRIYCFKCRKTFTWRRSEAPEQCAVGKHKWEPGMFARPDFLIYEVNDVLGDILVAVVRIDGPIHDSRRQKIKDKFQVQAVSRREY